VRNTPADGMVTGIGTVNAAHFGPEKQPHRGDGLRLHRAGRHPGLAQPQEDRPAAGLAHQWQLPVVLFAEGGGGRPGDVDWPSWPGWTTTPSARFAALSGQVPVVGVVHGRCFAGNAALLGCCDVIIATRSANIGMGGPAMIEGGGLGVFRPRRSARRPCSMPTAWSTCWSTTKPPRWPPPSSTWATSRAAPPTGARRPAQAAPPGAREPLRVYDMRAVITALATTGSVLELRRGFGAAW
jgi:acetyl-CoA carboxylase carboxyltransferase component